MKYVRKRRIIARKRAAALAIYRKRALPLITLSFLELYDNWHAK